jgi:hypothetical protein
MKKKIIIVAIIIAAIATGFFGWKKYQNYKTEKEKTMSVWEALVMVADQTASDPVEDARASLKRGDVIAIFPEGHPWSDTERTSYLIVKIKTTQENAQKLLEPVTKEIKTPSAPTNAGASPPSKEGEGIKERETVRARKYHLSVSVPTVNELMIKGQPASTSGDASSTRGGPYGDKVFEEGIIEQK